MPSGIGIYVRNLSSEKYGTPEEAAAKARDNGVSFVAILTVWQEASRAGTRIINRPNTSKFVDYVQAFTEAGVDIWLWGYPWQGKESGFISRMQQALQAVPGYVKGIILDPELGYKWQQKIKEKRAREAADRLVNTTLDFLNEDMNIGVTSFGQPKIHRNFPWEDFVAGFGSPQFYEVGQLAIKAGIKQWADLGFRRLLPSVPAFGPNSNEKLDEYLQYFPADEIDGFIVWSWPQIDKEEWEVIEKWAGRFESRSKQSQPYILRAS